MSNYGGHSMASPLKRVLVCPPSVAGWNGKSAGWERLGYFHEPEASLAETQHSQMVAALEKAGAAVESLSRDDPSDLTLDAVYAHDSSLITDGGAICMRMGKPTRRGEVASHRRVYASLGIPILGTIQPPGMTEAGDMVWLDERTLLVGEGFRTNREGIDQMQALLLPLDVEVVAASLPFGPGPDACLHLMSLMSVVDDKVVLVDRPWLSVATHQRLERSGVEMIPIDESEREQMACNVLALGKRRLLAIDGNDATNARLTDAGFEVQTYAGSEISRNGSGGPTCLTRPIWRGVAS